MKYGKDLFFPRGWRAKGLEILRISEDLGSPLNLKKRLRFFQKLFYLLIL